MYTIDVRSSDEFEQGHLPDAINLDIRQIAQGTLPNVPKDTEIQVYCASGARSSLAKMILEQNGFAHVTDLGGMV